MCKRLQKKGYKWLVKRQKRVYNKEMKEKRRTFAEAVLRLTNAQLKEKLAKAREQM